jgi:hypothetical protein
MVHEARDPRSHQGAAGDLARRLTPFGELRWPDRARLPRPHGGLPAEGHARDGLDAEVYEGRTAVYLAKADARQIAILAFPHSGA